MTRNSEKKQKDVFSRERTGGFIANKGLSPFSVSKRTGF
jgi:hypothetical protein